MHLSIYMFDRADNAWHEIWWFNIIMILDIIWFYCFVCYFSVEQLINLTIIWLVSCISTTIWLSHGLCIFVCQFQQLYSDSCWIFCFVILYPQMVNFIHHDIMMSIHSRIFKSMMLLLINTSLSQDFIAETASEYDT